MRPVLLCLSLVVMVSSLEAFIDCETSCSKCKDNADDPEIIDVYCSMCSECTERIEAQRGSKEQQQVQEAQPYEENGHKEDHQEDITPMPPLPGIDDASIPDQTKEALELEKLLRPRKPAPRIEKQANQWRNMPRLLPTITATLPLFKNPKRQRLNLKKRSPKLHKLVAAESRAKSNSCPFAQAARNDAVPRALRQDYLNWPVGCPTPAICSDDDSYEEVPTHSAVPPIYLHENEPPANTRTKSTTTTSSTTPRPTCPTILTCRKKRIKTPMPCAVGCMPMCCPPMSYNGNNGMTFGGNNGVPNGGNNRNNLQYMSQTGNINPNKPNNMPLNANEDNTGSGNTNVYNEHGNNAHGPGNINVHSPNNNMPMHANENNQGNINVYDMSGNNPSPQNMVQNGNNQGNKDNGNIQNGPYGDVQTVNSQIGPNGIVQNGNNQHPQNGNVQNGYHQSAPNGIVHNANHQNAQNGIVHNANHQNAQNGIVQNRYNQNGQHYNIQNNGNKNSDTGSGNQNAYRLPNVISVSNYNQGKSNNLNQGSNAGGNVNGRVEISTEYYNLYVGVPLGLLGPGTDPWRRSLRAQRRNDK